MNIEKTKFSFKCFAVLLAVSTLSVSKSAIAQQAEWSPWQPMSGVPLSIRYVQVNNTLCAMAFRNDSGAYFKGARLVYVHSGISTPDILPSMQPGQSFGGWTAFSVDDLCQNVQVRVFPF